MTQPKPLSPAAQAVLDAVVDGALPPFHLIARPMAAAALRAVVQQIDHSWDGAECVDFLQAIAAELEGFKNG